MQLLESLKKIAIYHWMIGAELNTYQFHVVVESHLMMLHLSEVKTKVTQVLYLCCKHKLGKINAKETSYRMFNLKLCNGTFFYYKTRQPVS